MSIHFKHGSTTLCIDHTEIGFNAARLLDGIEEMTEIRYGRTDFQGTIDYLAILRTSIIVSDVTEFQVITLGIHQGKASSIRAYPGFFQRREIITVYIGYEIILLAFHIRHVITQVTGFTILPQERTTIRSHLSRNHR